MMQKLPSNRPRFNSDLTTDFERVAAFTSKKHDNIRITFEKFSLKKKQSRSGYSTGEDTPPEIEA
jgi:hypothetical protein